MDGYQNRIARDLESMAGSDMRLLYVRLVCAIEKYDSNSSEARVDLLTIGHYARELMNALPIMTDGASGKWANYSGEELSATNRLKKILHNNPYTFDGTHQPNEVTPISTDIAQAISDLSEAVQTGRSNAKLRSSVAVLGYPDATDPAIISWDHAHQFFMRFTHYARDKETDDLPTPQELRFNFKRIENALSLRAGHFFEAKRALTELLNDANRCGATGEYGIPDKNTVLTAVSQLGDRYLRWVFFSELENPNWITPLNGLGVFNEPPGMYDINHPAIPWPEAAYLERVASTQPNEVRDILLKFSDDSNPSIRHLIIRLAASLPDTHLQEVVSVIITWAKEKYQSSGYFWSTEEVSHLLVLLLDSTGEKLHSKGCALIYAIFRPYTIEVPQLSPSAQALVGDFAYYEMLSPLLLHLTQDERFTFCRRMMVCLCDAHALHKGGPAMSEYWLPSIKTACESPGSSIEYALTGHLVSSICDLINAQKPISRLMNDANHIALTRCAMYALCGAHAQGISIEPYRDDVRNKVLSADATDIELEAEYYPLVNLALLLNYITINELLEHFQRVHSAAEQDWEELLRTQFSKMAEADISRQARNHADEWFQKSLSLVEKDYLNMEGLTLLDGFYARMGEHEYHLGRSFESQTIFGPDSPLSSDQMASLGSRELLAWLSQWHPSDSDRNQLISYSGVERTLSALVEAQPYFFNELCLSLSHLRPIYQRGILYGWESAVRQGDSVPIPDVLILAKSIVQRKDGIWQNGESSSSFDDDIDFRPSKRGVASVLKTILESSIPLDEAQLDATLNCLISILSSIDSEEPLSDDPVHSAINQLKPIALTALEDWVYRSTSCKENGLTVLENYLPDTNESEAEVAALALSFGRLCGAAYKWSLSMYSRLFGSIQNRTEGQKLLLTIILATHAPTAQMFRFLRTALVDALRTWAPEYQVATSSGYDGNCVTLIGTWLYVGYVNGYIGCDDILLSQWRQQATANELGEVLAKLCRNFSRSPTRNRKLTDKVLELWDFHNDSLVQIKGAEALQGSDALIRSGLLKPEIWSARAIKQLNHGYIDEHYYISPENIIALSKDNPFSAVDLLLTMLAHSDAIRYYQYEKVAVEVVSEKLV